MPLTILIDSAPNNPANFIQISQSDSEFVQTLHKHHEEMLFALQLWQCSTIWNIWKPNEPVGEREREEACLNTTSESSTCDIQP